MEHVGVGALAAKGIAGADVVREGANFPEGKVTHGLKVLTESGAHSSIGLGGIYRNKVRLKGFLHNGAVHHLEMQFSVAQEAGVAAGID